MNLQLKRLAIAMVVCFAFGWAFVMTKHGFGTKLVKTAAETKPLAGVGIPVPVVDNGSAGGVAGGGGAGGGGGGLKERTPQLLAQPTPSQPTPVHQQKQEKEIKPSVDEQPQQQPPKINQQALSPSTLPKPIIRPLATYKDDGNNGCWKGGPRDFEARPIVVFQTGASGMKLPPLDICDVPCFTAGDGGLMNRADVFTAWEGSPQAGSCSAYQKTMWVTMENYEHRSPPSTSYHATVSLKSDVPVPYLSWFDFEPMKPIMRYNKTDDALATAFISNCGASDRRAFVEGLMNNGVVVHSFGGCLHNKNEAEVSSVSGKYERKMDIMSKYLFHLSFENSRTRDYVTEKFFQTLEAGVVPVYFGAPNIEDFQPAPGTILHIDDFAGPAEVAAEMKRLAADRDAYWKMLEWKKKGPSNEFKALFDLNVVHSQCRLCLKTADDFVLKYGDAHGGVAPEHRSVDRESFPHILVRERNMFYFYVVPLSDSERTISGLHKAIMTTFQGYVPLFARHEKLVKLRNYKGKFMIHRIYPPYINVYDTLYGAQALTKDAQVANLTKGTKLEVIFLEAQE